MSTSDFSIPQVTDSLILERPHNFSSPPFATDILTKAFLVAVDVPGQISFFQGFSFHNLTSVFFTDSLSLVLPFIGLLFCVWSGHKSVSESVQELFVHPCRHPGVFA